MISRNEENCRFLWFSDRLVNRHIILMVSAMASGADGWEAIEDFGKEKLDWLRKYIPFENGVPSHDCITYVLSRLSPNKFRECFMN